LRVAQEAEDGKIQTLDEALQLIRRSRALIDPHSQHADLAGLLQIDALGELG
jgi:hypothetical protein